MKTTITIFVKPDSLVILMEVLKILENLDINNDYVFNPKDIIFSEKFNSEWVQVNIPLDEYLKFKFCYNKYYKNVWKRS